MKRFFLLLMAILLLSPSGIIATEVSAQTNEKRIYSCAFDGFVNMREEPSSSAKKVGKFNNGPEGAVLLEHLGEWVKIDASGTIGYVPTKYTQETPTIAYTGDVSVDWIEGIWKQGGTSLKIYNNGTWEKGYDFEQARGKYILQNNEIKFMTTRSHDKMAFNEVLPINREENRLGDYERGDFLTPEEYEEMSEEDGYDYGSVSKEEFRAAGKQLLEEIESLTNKPQEYQAENVVSKNTETNEDVQDLTSIDVAEEIEYAKTPFFESETFYWIIRAIIVVLAFLLVLWLAKLIKKTNQRSKEKRLAKTQNAEKITQNKKIDTSKDAGKSQSRKRFPWAAIIIPAIIVVAALAAIKMFGDRERATSYNLIAIDKTDSKNNTLYGYGVIKGRDRVKWRIKPQYLFAKNFEEGVGIVKDIDGKWKCINSGGEELFVSEHGEIVGFDDELFAIKGDNGFWGFVDKDNAVVVPFVISKEPNKVDERYWLNGTCIIERGEAIIDMTGQTITKPLEYDTILGQYANCAYLKDKYGRVCVMTTMNGPTPHTTVLDWDYYDEIYYAKQQKGGVAYVGKIHLSRNDSSLGEIDDIHSAIGKSNFRVNRYVSGAIQADTTKYYTIEDLFDDYCDLVQVYPRIGTLQGTFDHNSNKVKFRDSGAGEYYYKVSSDNDGRIIQCLEDNTGRRTFPPVFVYTSHPNSSGLAAALCYNISDSYTGKCIVNVQTGYVIKVLKNGEVIESLFDDDGMARIKSRLGSVAGDSYSYEYLLDSQGVEYHDKEAEKAVSKAYYSEKHSLEERAHELVEARRASDDNKPSAGEDYRWIEGTWYSSVGGATIIYQFKAKGDNYGTYTIGATMTNYLEMGNWSISENRVRLWNAETQITSNLYIEGKTLKDSDGSVLVKK